MPSAPPPQWEPPGCKLGIPHALTWNLEKKATLPVRFTLQRNSWGGRRAAAVPALHCYILSCGVCLSEWQLLLPRALGSRYLYRAGLQHRGGSTSPALMSSSLMTGAMSTRGRTVTLKWQASLSSPSPSSLSSAGFLWLCGATAAAAAAERGFLSNSLWLTFSLVSFLIYLA